MAEVVEPKFNRHIVWLNKHAPKPDWLRLDPCDDKRKSVSYRYWMKIWHATPLWATREPIAAIYLEAARRRAAGEDVTVDHIVPLTSDLVCGLHWHENLRIIDRLENARKSNHWWPGMPKMQECFSFYS